MNQSLQFGAGGVRDLQVLWEDGERVFCRGWSTNGEGGADTMLAVLPVAERPLPASLDRLAHEYGLRDELDAAWAARPLALVSEGGRTALLLEDPDGEPLERLVGEPMEVGRFAHLAVGIAAALGNAHQRGLVHKDVKPANILVNCADGRTRLTGFGIASRLPRERQAPEPPEVIAGTLAYMAPEQTGRMNRSINSRSDLYALGVTFYRMLTGSLPFSAGEPMEWVHCHIARKPVAPAQRLESVPAVLSEIVMKLLAKTTEERYQTAAGLEHDLRRCLAEWELKGRIEPFALGERDTPDWLMIPEKLYGRAREAETLLAAFERVVESGAPELVLVSGYSGIGKSSVVNELHKALVPSRGLFASGKLDQQKRDIPYSTLAQAFQSLVRPLLGKSDAELARWREALLVALGPNGGLMTDLVPELKLIVGEQLPIPELEPQQALGRFQLVFRRFIGVFASAEHPLVLFLDDLQWLDAATLDLLEDLLTQVDVQHLLVIGAYRDNEVDAAHPLTGKLTVIRSSGAKVSEVRLGPLDHGHIGRLIADALHCELEDAASLSELVHTKTAGNPFFVLQFLLTLADERLLTFDHERQRYSWDLNRIHAKGYADNVADLMVGKLARLPDEAREALQQLACLGNVADTTTLSIVLGTAQVHAPFWEAVRLELVERLPGAYRFVHDRVQEAAYSLISAEQRATAHLRIGRLLVAHTSTKKLEEAVFEIVGQLNRGATLIASQGEREHLAELNLLAGRRAKASTAYASALGYLVAGGALLPTDCWKRRHELAFALELNRAECEFVTGDLAAANKRLADLSQQACDTVERATVACLRVDLYTALDQSNRAVEVCLDCLRHVGIDLPTHPTEMEARREYERVWSQLGSREIEELVDLPLMTDPESLATLDVLTKVSPPSMFTDGNLNCLVTCKAVNLSLERGNCDGSCVHYVWLGCLAGALFGDYKAGYKFGQVGYELAEGRGLRRFQARTYVLFGGLLVIWTKHLRAGRGPLRRAFEIADRIGDLTFASFSRNNLNINLLAAGDPLSEVRLEVERGLEFVQKLRFGLMIDIIAAQLGLVRTLLGLTTKFGSLEHEQLDGSRIERRFSENPDLAIAECLYWIRRLQGSFFAGDYAMANEAASRAKRLLWRSPGQFETAEYHFYAALSYAAACDRSSFGARERAALGAHHRQLEIWAENCPENFENRAALVGAEMARLEGREIDAERLYEQAIRSARANAFVHNEALAYELAARFYAARGFEDFAHVYQRRARDGYVRWGADGKVRQLDEIYPSLRTEESAPAPTSTIGAPVERLDLATVIRVSQAISGEIVVEKLIDTLMRTAIEQAGAERGLLILARGAEQRIEAEVTTDGDAVIVQLRDQAVSQDLLPESVLHYVVRTRESVILDDAAIESAFAEDSYIRERRARSILCLPLINQTKLAGVLYLENNLARSVFAPARIAVLKLLASQAAISLENTHLYRDLAEREARIQRLVNADIIGIVIWNIEGQILEANDAFLRMVGYDREDLVSGRLSWTDLTPPEWDSRNAKTVREVRMTGTAQPFEKEYFRKDGSRVPVLIGSASFEKGGNQGVAFVLDLTERKVAEAALRESEEQWKAVFENNPTMYFMLDPTGTILSVNPFGAQQLGYTTDELIGRPVEILFHEDDRDYALRSASKCLEHFGRTASWELRKIRKNGDMLWVRETARAMLIKNRPVVLVVCEDITEGKRAAEALRETQMQLTHANRVATMGQLTASIAHEVNQPIAATVANAQAALRWLAAEPPNMDEVRQALGRIVRDGDRAGAVVGRVRALIKGAPPRDDRVEINGAIREVIDITRDEAMKSGVVVQTELVEGLPLIRGNRVELQQVILNLIVNALEAMSGMSEGSRELRIGARTTGSGDVLVAVCDSGLGLAQADLEHLFKAFYTTKPSGLGLGLSICRSIIEAHGGRLWASANAPRGAVFQFTLPANPDMAPRR